AAIARTLEQSVAPIPCLLLLPDGDGMLCDRSGIGVAADDPVLGAVPGPGASVVSLAAGASRGARVLAAAGVKLIVALRVEDSLEGLLAVGPKRSGAAYGSHDLRLLRTLGNQSAIALRNAASYAAVRELSATLEQRVVERTQDLARTHEALFAAQAHLARAARIVRELTAFARAPHHGREPTDLHAGLDRALQLLRGEYRDRIEIRREYGDIPRPFCNPGQIDQVFMNLLTNAVQAVEGQ